MDTILQNMKSFTFETVSSSIKKQEQLEVKLTFVANQEAIRAQLYIIVAHQGSLVNKQDEMDAQLNSEIARQNDMGSNIKVIKKLPEETMWFRIYNFLLF